MKFSNTIDGYLLKQKIAAHADRIASLFVEGSKVTVIIRHPKHPNGEVVVTDDDLEGVIKSLQTLQKDKDERPATGSGGTPAEKTPVDAG